MTGVVLNIPGFPGETGFDLAPRMISAAAACAATAADREADGVVGRVPNSEEGAVRAASAAADGFRFGLATGLRGSGLAFEIFLRVLARHGEHPGCRISAWPDERGTDVVRARVA